MLVLTRVNLSNSDINIIVIVIYKTGLIVIVIIIIFFFLKIIVIQSNLVNPALLLSGNLLFGQNFSTPKFFIIPLHVSVRKCQKKYTVIRIFCNPEFRIKCNRFLNFFHIH
jgi:hypothetical protein